MAGLLVLAHENICQISSRGRVFRPQVKGLHECLFFPLLLLPTALHPHAKKKKKNPPKDYWSVLTN